MEFVDPRLKYTGPSQPQGPAFGGDTVRKYVVDLVEEYGPFLPYTVLFGLPEGSYDYPLWTNLLQKGLRGFGFFAETWTEAWHLAAPAMESLYYTSSDALGRPDPRRIQYILLTRYGRGQPAWEPAFWQGVYGAYRDDVESRFFSADLEALTHGVNGSSAAALRVPPTGAWNWQAGWQRIYETFLERRAKGVRGPTHWMVMFAGAHRVVDQLTGLEEFFREGPRYAMWPVVVDAYAHWEAWKPFLPYLGLEVYGAWKQVHEPVRLHLKERWRVAHPEMLLDLRAETALLVSRRGHVAYQVPQAEVRWREVIVQSYIEAIIGDQHDRPVEIHERPVPSRYSRYPYSRVPYASTGD